MDVFTHFCHLSRNEGLDSETENWLRGQFSTHDQHIKRLDLYVSKASAWKAGRGPVFECHLKARGDGRHKLAFAKSQDGDFWTAIANCAEKLAHQFERRLYAG